MLTILESDRVEKPYDIISLDTESDENGVTYVWCVSGFRGKKEINRIFKNRTACVRFLFHQKWRHTILTGLNLAFDLNTLYGYNNSFNWQPIMNMGKLITAYPSPEEMEKRGFKKQSEYLKIMDLGNFIHNMSLKQMADVFKIPGHIDKHILGRDGDVDEMTEACLSHCMTGVKIMEEIQNKIHNLGGNLKLTGPSTSLELFRRKYLKPEFQIFDFKQKGVTEEQEQARVDKIKYIKDIGKLAYVGGRVEAFKLGLYNDVGYLDINSSYPYQMSVRTMPDMTSFKRYTKNLTDEFLSNLLESEEGEALVQIYCPAKIKIPYLHSKDENGKLVFPKGELYGWFTFPEIKYALTLGYKIRRIDEIASFRRSESMFKEYVADMIAYKAECKPVAKLLANGLSGKFGERVPENDQWLICDDKDVVIDHKEYFSINGQVWRYIADPEPVEEAFKDFAYPLIIAYVTAWGRIQEHKTIMSIGPENVYYMDTDSIIADQGAIDKAVDSGKIWIDSKALGAYGSENRNATVEIRGEKYYRIHDPGKPWTYHIKGVPHGKNDDIVRQYWINKKCAYYRARKIKTALRSGLQVNEFIRVFHQDRSTPSKRIYGWRGRTSEAYTVHEG